jgi:DNA mismatch endonuclease (patch repair protein)
MARVKTKGTAPEVLLRHELWRRGFRYRVNVKTLPGSPDLVFPKYRTTVFVNGCFWHGHEGCGAYVVPKTNTAFWKEKVQRNRERDQRVWRALLAKGWEVLFVWECELSKDRLEDTVSKVSETILENGLTYEEFQKKRKEENLRHLVEDVKKI